MTETINENIGMLGYFPWAIAAPRNDWTSGDDTTYSAGTYPEIEELYESQGIIDYRVDRHLTSATDAVGLQEVLVSSQPALAWRVFQNTPAGGLPEFWYTAGGVSNAYPQHIGLSTGGKKHTITEVVLYPRTDYNCFPKRAMLQASDNGVNWYNLLDAELSLKNEVTSIKIPEKNQRTVSMLRLELYESYYTSYAGISRMRVFAKGLNSPIVTRKDMGGQRKMPHMSEWCLRVGKKAAE